MSPEIRDDGPDNDREPTFECELRALTFEEVRIRGVPTPESRPPSELEPLRVRKPARTLRAGAILLRTCDVLAASHTAKTRALSAAVIAPVPLFSPFSAAALALAPSADWPAM